MWARPGLTPLTGRDLEITLLKDRWERAQEGAGQIVLLIGEPGLGKSRLVYTMKQLVREQADVASSSDPAISLSQSAAADPPVVEWRCSGRLQNTGLHPATEFFARFLGLGMEDTPSARFERLVQHLRDYDLARPDLVPLSHRCFRSPWTTLSTHRPALGSGKGGDVSALIEWLGAYSGRRPVLFVVEDLHWADASTLEFLQRFFAEGLHDRILTVLTFRPEFQPPWPTAAHQTSLALTCLTRRQVVDLMVRKTGVGVPEAWPPRCTNELGECRCSSRSTPDVQEPGLRLRWGGCIGALGCPAARNPLDPSGPDHGEAGSNGG